MGEKLTAYIKNYGCSANLAESEMMAGLLSKSGINLVSSASMADIIIINSCSVKAVTEQKILHRIKQLQARYPEKRVIIAGCMPESIPQKLKNEVPFASLISTNQIFKIESVVRKTIGGDTVRLLGGRSVKSGVPRVRVNKLISIIEISDGCAGACTFCATKLAKKGIFSYPQEKIIEDVRESVRDGCKEIWLTSQDLGAYGLDKGKRDLPELIKEICLVKGDFKIRLGMINPNHILKMLPALVNIYKHQKVYKFLHIPIQSGDNQILKDMNRSYSTDEVKKIINTFRSNFPKIQIWTDIIVGYPHETEEQFKNTYKLVKEIRFDQTNVSRFAKREGTAAAKLKQLPTDIVKLRTNKLSKLVRQQIKDLNNQWIGWEGKILITERGKKSGQWVGRNFAYKQIIVDGRNFFGQEVYVRISGTSEFSLLGELIDKYKTGSFINSNSSSVIVRICLYLI